MKQRHLAALGAAAIAAAAVLAACGGGGGGSGSVAPGSNITNNAPAGGATTPAAGTLAYAFKITVPAGTTQSTARHIKLVPSNTKSIVFTLNATTGTGTAGSAQGPFGLTATSPGCSQDNAGNINCTLQINAPIGQDIFTATIYSTTNAAAGTQIGSGAVALSVALNAQNQAQLSLNGPIASVALGSDCPSLIVDYFGGCVLGDPAAFYYNDAVARKSQASSRKTTDDTNPFPSSLATMRLFAIALDAGGNPVVNPTTYDQPVTLLLSGSQGLLALNVSYASVSQALSGAPSATSVGDGTVQLWSPLDTVTTSLVPNMTTPCCYSVWASITAGIGPSTPVAPFGTPTPYISPAPVQPTPGPFIEVAVYEPPPPGPITAAISPYSSPGPYSNPLTITNNTVQFLSSCGGGYPCSSSATAWLTDPGFNGQYTVDTTTDPRCAQGAVVGGGTGPVVITSSYDGTDYFYSDWPLWISPENAGFCTINISDGLGNTYQINTSVTTSSVTGQ